MRAGLAHSPHMGGVAVLAHFVRPLGEHFCIDITSVEGFIDAVGNALIGQTLTSLSVLFWCR